jgi:hypothetical protein
MSELEKTISHQAGIDKRRRDLGLDDLLKRVQDASKRLGGERRIEIEKLLDSAYRLSGLRALWFRLAPLGSDRISEDSVVSSIKNMIERVEEVRATIPAEVLVAARNAARVKKHRAEKKRSLDFSKDAAGVFREYARARGLSLTAALSECVGVARVACLIDGYAGPVKEGRPLDAVRRAAASLGVQVLR